MTAPLFVAVPVPAAVAARLAAVQNGVPGARWVAAGDLHVTLRYLGSPDGAAAGEIAAGLAGIEAAAFELALRGCGHFSGPRGARVLYAGLAPSPPLRWLRDGVEALARRAGLEAAARRWRPHVTLARARSVPAWRIGRFLEANGLLATPPFRVEAFALYESHRGRCGARYVELERYPLVGGEASEGAA